MAKINKLRGKAAGTGFFAFQDIITTVIGFVILVILFQITLTRGILGNLPQSGSDYAAKILNLELEAEALRAQISALNITIDQATQVDHDEDESRLREETDLMARLAAAKLELYELEQKLIVLSNANGVVDLSALADSIKKERARIVSEITGLEEKIHESTRRRDQLSSNLVEVQRNYEEALRTGQRLWIIPEATTTGRLPVFGVVSESKIEWFRAGDERPRVVSTRSDWSGGKLIIRNHAPSSHYAVLYFRPDGAHHFNLIVRSLRDSGYMVGYDTITQSQAIEFKLD